MSQNASYEKQLLLLEYYQSNQEIFIKVNPIVLSKFFDVRLQKSVKFIQDYFNQYKALPSPDQINAETNVNIKGSKAVIDTAEKKYAETELETFCKQSAMECAIYDSVDLIKQGKLGEVEKLVKDAVTMSLQRSLGTNYFDDPAARLKYLLDSACMYTTKWNKLDHALAGGLNKKEMIIFAAPSGVGKSVTMLNLGFNLMSQGLNGVYFTFELSEEIVSKRADSITSGLSQIDLLKDITKTSIAVMKFKNEQNYGDLTIKRLPESTTNSHHLRAYLKEYELVNGRGPDFIIVDYIDIMASSQLGISPENQFIKDKYVCEELRAIANDFDTIMISASQLGRSSHTIESLDDLGQEHIAGGISKINTADNVVMLVQSPQNKARQELVFKLVKTRSSSGVGSYFILKFSPITLRITNLEEDELPKERGAALAAFTLASKKTAAKALDPFQV